MDATEDLVDAKMTARQSGRQRAAVGMDVGSTDGAAYLAQAGAMIAASSASSRENNAGGAGGGGGAGWS